MEKEIIKTLEEIKKNQYDFSDVDKSSIADICMKHIGDQRSEIRDDLVYGILAHLFHDQHFNENELTQYLDKLTGFEFMLFDLDNKQPYSVLVRSFSILQLAILVYVHRRDDMILKPTINKLYNDFIVYFDQEKILTGYDLNVGWIHTIAHSADLFAQLMQVSWFTEAHIAKMFEVIANKIKQKDHFFTFNEDERLVVAIKKGIERQILSSEYILSWLNHFLIEESPKEYPQRTYYHNNIKCFLRSLYFALIEDSSWDWITNKIKDILSKNK